MALASAFAKWFCGTQGQDLIEYGLLGMFLAICVVLILPALGISLATLYRTMNQVVTDAVTLAIR